MPLFGAKHPQLADMGIVHYSWHSQKTALMQAGFFNGFIGKFSIKRQIKAALNFTSDDWIKSPVKNNFDFILDQYKYACCAKQKDIATAVKEIEDYFEQSKTII